MQHARAQRRGFSWEEVRSARARYEEEYEEIN